MATADYRGIASLPELQFKIKRSMLLLFAKYYIIIIIIIINSGSSTLVTCLGLDACFFKINSWAKQWKDSG